MRETLRAIGRRIPLEVHEVPSGTQVLDWTVPDEWNIRDAYIARADGERVVDFQAVATSTSSGTASRCGRRCRSTSCGRTCTRTPERPDWIPYRTSYYNAHLGVLPRRSDSSTRSTTGEYEVVVDSTLAPGSLTYGECFLAGRARGRGAPDDARLPPLARERQPLRDRAARPSWRRSWLAAPRRLSYRLLFIPGTIGSIAWLARNEDAARARRRRASSSRAWATPAPLRTSAAGAATRSIDRAGAHVVGHGRRRGRCSTSFRGAGTSGSSTRPGFDLPVGCLTRSREGEYPEYHSSARRSRARAPRAAGGLAAGGARRSSTSSSTTAPTQPLPRRASRSSVGGASTATVGGPDADDGAARDALGAEPVGRDQVASRRGGAGRAFRSRWSVTRRRASKRPGWSRRRKGRRESPRHRSSRLPRLGARARPARRGPRGRRPRHVSTTAAATSVTRQSRPCARARPA